MRVALFALATLIAASAAGVQPSDAQSRDPKPWCISGGSYGPGSLDCTYFTLNSAAKAPEGRAAPARKIRCSGETVDS